jgi:CO/xanthine dehydrogenase Mo-binding subunit
MHFAFSFGVQAAEVEVNKLTGEVRVLRVISANDVGMASTRSACRDRSKAA